MLKRALLIHEWDIEFWGGGRLCSHLISSKSQGLYEPRLLVCKW